MAVELAPRNVLVNLIRCAIVATPGTIGLEEMLGDLKEKIQEYQPLGMIPTQNVAQMAVWLLSDAARYSSGCVFTINAGAQS